MTLPDDLWNVIIEASSPALGKIACNKHLQKLVQGSPAFRALYRAAEDATLRVDTAPACLAAVNGSQIVFGSVGGDVRTWDTANARRSVQ